MENWLIYPGLLIAGIIIGSMRNIYRKNWYKAPYEDGYYYREPVMYRHRPMPEYAPEGHDSGLLIVILTIIGIIFLLVII
jgi:hypothetical protein